MNYVIVVSFLFLSIHLVTAPPPRRTDQKEVKDEKHEKDDIEDIGFEYNRYLKEVIDLLESDPEFKRKLEDAHEADIRSGKIAHELEFVDHKVRTKLDEVKRQELERLRHLAQKQFELNNGIDTEHMKISSEHLDHENPHTFEMEDLKKLIAKVSSDLVKADEKRRQEFKEYEMQKEFEKQEKLKHLEGSEKEAFEKQLQENETKHKQHEPLHHPGSKQQLEEVWEKQDHMENQDFDPKVFFQLHDLDGNGVWDQNEVKTLFLKELDKMYEQGAPEDDMRERAEEMERMREHVFSESDKNKDGLISYDEFLDKTRQPDFEKDPGWETVDQKPAYTYEEYKEFERRRQEEVQRLIQQGLIPPQPVYHDYGYLPQQPGYGHPNEQYHQQHMQGYHPQMGQGHPNQQGYNQNQFNPNYPNVGHHNSGGNVNYQQQQQQQHFQPSYQQQGQHNYPQQHQPQGQDQQQQHHPNSQQHHNVNNQQQQQYQPNSQQQEHYQPNSHHQQEQQHQANSQQNHNVNNQQQQYQSNSHHQQQQQYQSNDHHQQQQQYQSNDHHQQQQQYQPNSHNQKDYQANSHQNINHEQPSQNAPQASQDHSSNLDHGQLNQHHQQPSQADVKPPESYASHPNSKTGSFQKEEGDLSHKEIKNSPQSSSNHL